MPEIGKNYQGRKTFFRLWISFDQIDLGSVAASSDSLANRRVPNAPSFGAVGCNCRPLDRPPRARAGIACAMRCADESATVLRQPLRPMK